MIFTQSLPGCDFSEALQTASRLDQLSRLYKRESDRAKIPELLSSLGEIIEASKEMDPKLFEAILIKGGIPRPDGGKDDYLSCLPLGLDTVKEYANAIFLDLSRIQPDYPIFRRSGRGLGGVTFVEFDDINFVVKWANPIEKGASKIYALFLEILGDPLLRVPESTQILDEEVFPAHLHPELRSVGKPLSLLAFPKVPGAPLLDFIEQKYSLLTPAQKNELLFELGKIAMLDAILLNDDRVISTKHWGCSNLANIMIEQGEGGIKLFLIDNELNLDKEMNVNPEVVVDQIVALYTPLVSVAPKTPKEENWEQFALGVRSSRALLLEGCNFVLRALKERLPARLDEIERVSEELDEDLGSKKFEKMVRNLRAFSELTAAGPR